MSTAAAVPETHKLEGDDAKEVLKRTGRWKLAKDAMKRLIAADGMSHVRAIAHASVLTAIPGLIALVGLASTLEVTSLRTSWTTPCRTSLPAPRARWCTRPWPRGRRRPGGPP